MPSSATHPLSLVSQTSIPFHLLSEEMGGRLLLATQATASRAIDMTDALIQELHSRAGEPKTDEWRNATSSCLDEIRYQALDAIEALYVVNYISLEEQNQAAKEINERGAAAKKALFSNPSPLLGAFKLASTSKAFIKTIEANKEKISNFAKDTNLIETFKTHHQKPTLKA